MLNVIIDDMPYPRCPIVPREGLRLRIGGQVRIVSEVEINPENAEIVCKTVSQEEGTKHAGGRTSEAVSGKTTTRK